MVLRWRTEVRAVFEDAAVRDIKERFKRFSNAGSLLIKSMSSCARELSKVRQRFLADPNPMPTSILRPFLDRHPIAFLTSLVGKTCTAKSYPRHVLYESQAEKGTSALER